MKTIKKIEDICNLSRDSHISSHVLAEAEHDFHRYHLAFEPFVVSKSF